MPKEITKQGDKYIINKTGEIADIKPITLESLVKRKEFHEHLISTYTSLITRYNASIIKEQASIDDINETLLLIEELE